MRINRRFIFDDKDPEEQITEFEFGKTKLFPVKF